MQEWPSVFKGVGGLLLGVGVASLFYLVPQTCLAGLDLGVVLGPSFANEIVTNPSGATTSNETYWSGGLWENLVFPDSTLAFTSGLLITQTGAKIQTPALAPVDSKTTYLQIPLVLGFWPTDWTAMGLGIYGGLPLSQTSGFTSSNAAADYGLALNGQVKIPLGVVTFFLLNVVYEYGLANVDTVGNNIRNFSLLIHCGLGLGF